MKNVYQIEFEYNGGWWKAHYDFDGILPEYTNKRQARSDMAQLRRDNPAEIFRLVTR